MNISIAAVLLLFSCDRMTRNGVLDGMWQYLSVSYHLPDGSDSVVNMKNKKVYMIYGDDLGQISPGEYANDSLDKRVLMRFDKSGKSLRLFDFTVYGEEVGEIGTERHSVERRLADSTSVILAPFGVNGIYADFHIDRLDGEKMVLSSDYANIILRKF